MKRPFGPARGPKGLRGSFAKSLFVHARKPAKLIEAVIRCNGCDRQGDVLRRAQCGLGPQEALGQDPPLGTYTVNAVEGIPETALAELDDAGQFRERNRGVQMGANLRFGLSDRRQPSGEPALTSFPPTSSTHGRTP